MQEVASMSPVRTLEEIVAEASLEKASRRYGRAADLLAEAGRSPEAEANPRRQQSLVRQAAACKYLDDTASRGARSSEALSLLTEQGPAPEVAARIKLAVAMKGEMAFGHARKLLAEARELLQQRWSPDLRNLEAKARQQHGLCTYKDVDLPPGDRLDEALRILDGTDPLAVPGVEGLRTTVDPETLGIAGAVHKAKWKYDAQRAHLERSLYYYDRGYREGRVGDRAGIAADDGYTAINAAFILDLLAFLEADDLGPDDRSIAERRAQARIIREQILATLPGVADEETRAQWWYAATLAEAEFGLGRFEETADELLAFLGDGPLIAHNAPFDLGFLNAELSRISRPPLEFARMIDTLALARQRFPGMPNSLDALCRRFGIDISERTMHNALLDCRLLAEVYVELTGGRQRGLLLAAEGQAEMPVVAYAAAGARTPRLIVPSEAELTAHGAFVVRLKGSLWGA